MSVREQFQKLPKILQGFFKRYPPVSSESWAKTGEERFNPFLPYRNEFSGRWNDPKYSNRRQADLYKAARRLGLEQFLPTESRWNQSSEPAGIIRGSRFFKKTIPERTLLSRERRVEEALKNMDARIHGMKLVRVILMSLFNVCRNGVAELGNQSRP